jgi:hypothetical protein
MDTVKDALMETSRYQSTQHDPSDNDQYQKMKIKGKIKINKDNKDNK